MGFYCATRGFPSNAQISKERKASRAKPLPTNRPRALTLPLEDDNGKDQIDRSQNILSRIIKKRARPQRTHDQKESSLITRLPYEIRLQIWRYLLCDQHLHLVRAPKRLLGIRCDEDESIADCNHKCWGYSFDAGYYIEKRKGARCENANILSVLKTCRLIYSETIALIYSGNTFDFDSPDTILSLSQTILPSRLNLLRVIRLEYSFPKFIYIHSSHTVFPPRGIPSLGLDQVTEDPDLVAPFDAKTWKQTCSVLASLAGLQELYMHLGGKPLDQPYLLPNNISPILCSLMQIRQPGLRVFEVSVSWYGDPETMYDVKGAPFRLLSRDSRCVCFSRLLSKGFVSDI